MDSADRLYDTEAGSGVGPELPEDEMDSTTRADSGPGEDGPRRRALMLARDATIVGVVGNPRPRSRTYQMVRAVADAFAAASGGRVEAVIDLVELKGWLFDYGAPQVAPALERALGADVLVVGSPVYKATYTGLLKAFCDHIIQGQLTGKLALPTMMGGAYNHALAVEHELRPLLVELGATCATPGLYVLESQEGELDAVARQYVERLAEGIGLEAPG
jgi:FMN reductase